MHVAARFALVAAVMAWMFASVGTVHAGVLAKAKAKVKATAKKLKDNLLGKRDPAQEAAEAAELAKADPNAHVRLKMGRANKIPLRSLYFAELIRANGLSNIKLGFGRGYGNWCGKGGDGETLDAYDACCKVHDECYTTFRAEIFHKRFELKQLFRMSKKQRGVDVCDQRAVRCWLAARAKDPARFGSGRKYKYPCAGCGLNVKLKQGAKKKAQCNAVCKPGMFPEKATAR